jgi:hypothetical protein
MIVDTQKTKINTRNQTWSSQRLELAHDIASLSVTLVYLGTVEVHKLLGWPHRAQALGNAWQRVVRRHSNG